jgi:hypothetical protein
VQLGHLFPEVSSAVLPLTTSIAVTTPVTRLDEAITYSGAVVETRGFGDFFRIVDGDRLMWGGGLTTRAAPRRIEHRLQQAIREVFPQLGNVEIASAWSGAMGYAVHRMPQIGEILPGLWITSAFGGHGLNTTAIAGELIARAIVDGDDTWRLFSSYDLVWAGGRLGRILVEVSLVAARLLDAAHQWRIRTQNLKRRQVSHTTPSAFGGAPSDGGAEAPVRALASGSGSATGQVQQSASGVCRRLLPRERTGRASGRFGEKRH